MSPDEMAKLEHRGVLLDVCELIATWNYSNGLPRHKTPLHETMYDALRANLFGAVAPTMVAVFRRLGLDVHTRGEEQTGQPVDINYHYAGGLPYVLIGDHHARCVVAIAPKDACTILRTVAQQTGKAQAHSKLLQLARQYSHP